jgi:hypothetical protein
MTSNKDHGSLLILNGVPFECEDCNNDLFKPYSAEPERVCCTHCKMIYWIHRTQPEPAAVTA